MFRSRSLAAAAASIAMVVGGIGAATLVAYPTAADAAFKSCRMHDPKNSKSRLLLTYNSDISCGTARRVMKTYLRRFPRPYDPSKAYFDIRVAGKTWSCAFTTRPRHSPTDTGGTDYSCGASNADHTDFWNVTAKII